jgi:predicted nucleic acid-binding protein
LGGSQRGIGGNPSLERDAASPIAAQTHETALRIAEQYSDGIYDALIAVAALQAGCVTLYSEDFPDGQIMDGQLTIGNPFS